MEMGGFFSHYGDFFGHPVGAAQVSRLRQIGYIRRRYVWIVGENLHWTAAGGSTPAEVVQAWMNSGEHRKYLLKRKFRDLGVATIRGIPYDPTETDWITVASEYGFRIRNARQRESGGRQDGFRTLHGLRFSGTEPAWPETPPGYTLASPSPYRTGGQITDRRPGADTDWAPGESASPDPLPIRLDQEPIERPQRKTNRTG